ncbi:MAG TPA: cysteine--tRNA ligase [Rhabdochlamydiaceae bacterium]|nr:cysteine--tRNA ligase [Rhabdochlamydiaceae bacterium]
MKLKLYNTETREKEEVEPLDGKTIRYYTCGPTVYDFAHIGNFRTYVFEDLLKRTLNYFGLKVIQVMNLTDVDDKTLNGALKKGVPLNEYTQPYIDAFFEDLKTLHIEPADDYPRATECIPDMIKLIQGLLEKGVAYQGEDKSIYYSIHAFSPYGRLSHLYLDDLKEGASEREAADEYEKENAADFVLWKAYDPKRDGATFWESPFGKGRPGWHIECSAMAMKILGPSIDIHAGGVDLIFPHHENEIAQSEAFSGQPFVRYWVHSEHLLVDHKKMSKRLGNFYTLRDLLKKGYSGSEVRYMLLHTHYRTQLNFTFQGLDGAVASLQRLSDFIQRLQEIEGQQIGTIDTVLKEAEKEFDEALADDLNISVALAALFELVRKINHLCDEEKIGTAQAQKILDLLKKWDQVLGVLPFQREALAIPQELLDALEKRNRARVEKNWAEADKQRAFIQSQGYLIEDTPKGAKLKKS